LLTLDAWREQHPDSIIALPPDEWTGLVPLKKVRIVLERATRSGVVPGLTPRDRRFTGNTTIIGLAYQDSACAYPLELLEDLGEIQDQLGDIPVKLKFDHSAKQVSLESLHSEQIIFRRTWWNGWYEFSPHTEIYQP
jgi:hypothetical protein